MELRGIWGALLGAITAAPLIAIFYLGHAIASLPFVPFDIFDWMARSLPGGVLTFGIDSLVKVIRGLSLGDTASVSKSAEHAMAIVGCVLTAAVAGAIFFALRPRGERSALAGTILGAVLGVPLGLLSAKMNATAGATVAMGFIWVVLAFASWGVCLEWLRWRLSIAGELPTREPIEAGERIDRRRMIVRVIGASAAVTAAGVAAGTIAGFDRSKRLSTSAKRWSETHALPNAAATVKPVPGTRPELTPLERHYRIDIDSMPMMIDAKNWALRISGLVEKPLELTLQDIRGRYEPMHQFVTLSCISNPVGGDLVGTTRWTGASMQRVLPDLGLRRSATHLKMSSADGFYEVLPLATIMADPRVMLTYDWDGVPLLPEHGFPLRIYIPNLYGMKQPKWIASIEGIDHEEPGYWVVRGWDAQARMKATSVIDVIASNHIETRGARRVVPVGGIARAGDRGISKVEVKVDDGPWQLAESRTPLSSTTWVLWRYEWPYAAGRHTFTVRCFDGKGTPQIETEAPPHPSGASGLHSRTVEL